MCLVGRRVSYSQPVSENSPKNQLFYGDNLDVLGRHVADESVDLVYLITSAMRFIWKRRPGMSSAVHSSVRFGVSMDSILFYVRSVLMGMTFAKHERISLRQSPDFSESWLHDRISEHFARMIRSNGMIGMETRIAAHGRRGLALRS